jgi:D-arabinose 5-phosphate isomerase GutQ
MDNRNYIDLYLKETMEIANKLDKEQIEKMVTVLSDLKKNNGRLFIIGVGG